MADEVISCDCPDLERKEGQGLSSNRKDKLETVVWDRDQKHE